jgi:outer membrane protein TolC
LSGSGQIITSEQEGSAGIEQKIITGAEYSLLFKAVRENSNSTRKTINPDFETRLTFSITQPLLKNFGIDVNKADIRIASFSRDQSLLAYKDRVVTVINNIEQGYWDLVFSIANLKFRRNSLELAKDLLRRNRIQVEVGTLAPIEILEAEATVAAREEDVIVADRQVKDQDDTLKKLLNVADSVSSWNLQITPKDKPTIHPIGLDEMGSTMKALQRRADLETARLEIEKTRVRLKKERQNLLPQLDISASAANQGVESSFGKSVDRQSGNKGYILSGGLSFRYPLGNRDAKANMEKARLRLLRANTTYSQLEQSIIEEVRRTIRRARTDRKRIEATRVARRLAEQRLDSQEKKLEVGLSTSRDVLEDQESVANALSNEVQALVDYNKSLAQLGRVTYSTLQRYRINIGDPRKSDQNVSP